MAIPEVGIVGLRRGAMLAVMLLCLTMASVQAPVSADTSNDPPTLSEILRFKSASASYDQFRYRYECGLNEKVRFDFTVRAGWDRNQSSSLRFIATMDPDYERKLDIFTGPAKEVDPYLAGKKHLADSGLVRGSYVVDRPVISTGEIAAANPSVVSMNLTFRTAGTWKVYVIYDVPGSGSLGKEGEEATIFVKGNPDGVSAISSVISLVLLVPLVAQAFFYFNARFSRRRPREP